MSLVLALALGISSGLNPYVTVAIASIVAARSDLLTPAPAFAFVASTGMFLGALLLFAHRRVRRQVPWQRRPNGPRGLGAADPSPVASSARRR